jgi:hypothetical protein
MFAFSCVDSCLLNNTVSLFFLVPLAPLLILFFFSVVCSFVSLQAPYTDSSGCARCDATTASTLDLTLGDCKCGNANAVLVEKDAAGNKLASKQCLPCPAGTRVSSSDPYTCVVCLSVRPSVCPSLFFVLLLLSFFRSFGSFIVALSSSLFFSDVTCASFLSHSLCLLTHAFRAVLIR